MKQKGIFSILLILVIIGAGYFILTRDILEYPQQEENEIWVGNVKIDHTQMEELQKAVDEGHQPWRLDPSEVAKIEGLNYGFREGDRFTLVSQELGNAPAATYFAYIEAEHQGKLYTIQVYQPWKIGDGAIWTIGWIKAKE